MIMKFCPNYRCVSYGRVVYTQSTVCVFCRWDLKPPRMKSETLSEGQVSRNVVERTLVAEAPAPVEPRPHSKRTALRRTA
jgi:hypothetical protein